MSATKVPGIDKLARDLGAMYELIRALSAEVDSLKARLKAIEDKRGPGRPRKQ